MQEKISYQFQQLILDWFAKKNTIGSTRGLFELKISIIFGLLFSSFSRVLENSFEFLFSVLRSMQIEVATLAKKTMWRKHEKNVSILFGLVEF